MAASIKGILFDKDGTLLDYHASWAPINERSAAHAAQGDRELKLRLLEIGGFDASSRRYRSGSLLAAGNAAEIARAWISAGSSFDESVLTADLDAIFLAGVATVVPVTSLASYFSGIRERGLTIGVASSDGEAAIQATLARFDCAHLVSFVAGYDSGFGPKPGPGMLQAFAATAGLETSEIAMVGDNWHDMEMARRAGAGLRVAVLTGTSSREELESHADICLASICELEAYLFG